MAKHGRKKDRHGGRAAAVARASRGLARVLSKRGVGSRSAAEDWVLAGRVSVNGNVVRDPGLQVDPERDRITLDGQEASPAARVYIALNKPRGVVTTTADERGRDTVYHCFTGATLPWLSPVGRLDKASEGLLLFTNDSAWAARLTDPASHVDKTYHVQINRVPDPALLKALEAGAIVEGEALRAKSIAVLRSGEKNAWLEVVLDEGRNRQIRRLLDAFEISVLRLVRVAIGPLKLGELAKSAWRPLTPEEVAALSA
ncbi:MAG TPA: pseudouridine synthase [Xanthomonadales bacterium]|nr:pseudouridine synthase [Xanthomonadales bacterium]